MKNFTIVFSLIVTLSVQGQKMPPVSVEADSLSFISVLAEIENQTGYEVYYKPVWMDSLTFTGSIIDLALNEALIQIFDQTPLYAYIEKESVYVTKDVKIIERPEIAKALMKSSEQGSSQNVTKGLLFTREYLNQNTTANDEENHVFEIGDRKKMTTGAQATVAGYVRDRESKEAIMGAVVYIQEPITATSTDENGFYSLSIPNGKKTLIIQYAGMKTTERHIVLFSNGQLNVNMDVDVIALQEVTVESERDANVQNVQMGVNRINVKETKNVPIVLGESDIMKIATTFAGVQSVGEGASGFNVRGGKSDQNLVILNDATVYNASHFFGFFSVFNSDAIQNMEVYKSGIPANFGGRLSSVFDIEPKEANREKFVGVGGISPITSRLTLEIPLQDGKAGLMVGGRSTYSNWILKRSKNANFNSNRVSFADLILRYDYDINEKNDVTVTGYYSKDKFRLSSDTLFSFSNFEFENANASAKWTHRFTNNLESSLSVIYSGYNYALIYDESAPNSFVQDFGIKEKSLNAQLSYFKDGMHTTRLGLDIKNYTVNPGTKMPEGEASIVSPQTVQGEQGVEAALYVSEEYILNDKLTFYGGLRYSLFSAYGRESINIYEPNAPRNTDFRTGEVRLEKGAIEKTYHGPELRFSAKYSINNASSIKASYNRTRQYIHTLTNSASLSPTDTWRLSNTYLKPQVADQYALGYYRNFFKNKLEASVEGYYKNLQNLLDFKVGANFLLNNQVETVALQGPGKSYGVEVSLKKSGKLNGWLNYSYARTFIQLDGNFPEEIINEGAYYPTNYDMPHTVNLVANYKMTWRLSFSYNFTYSTGRPITYPVGSFEFQGAESIHYSDRNAFRIPDYMRMDIGISLEAGHKLEKLAHSYWSFSVYNLLGRDNPFSVFFDIRDGEVQAYKLVVFGNPIPTISYNFRF